MDVPCLSLEIGIIIMIHSIKMYVSTKKKGYRFSGFRLRPAAALAGPDQMVLRGWKFSVLVIVIYKHLIFSHYLDKRRLQVLFSLKYYNVLKFFSCYVVSAGLHAVFFF